VKSTLVFVGVTLLIAAIMVCGKSLQFIDEANAAKQVVHSGDRKAPAAISGDNIYIAWWTNKTSNGNNEVMFRASTDGGATFGNKTNLSNTTMTDSVDAEIAAEGGNVMVTWWEINQTDNTPVARVSLDNGATFGPTLVLATNGTLGEAAEEGAEEEEE
jgi:hypothetical protein